MNPRAAMGDQWVSGVCLAPRPDHPQAAVDHKRDAPARARRTSPAASAAGLFAAEAKQFPEGPTGKTRRVIRGRSEGQTRGPSVRANLPRDPRVAALRRPRMTAQGRPRNAAP